MTDYPLSPTTGAAAAMIALQVTSKGVPTAEESTYRSTLEIIHGRPRFPPPHCRRAGGAAGGVHRGDRRAAGGEAPAVGHAGGVCIHIYTYRYGYTSFLPIYRTLCFSSSEVGMPV